jgi:mannose-6-phosphate isomerase-like protein (cupin superfamily)
MARRALKSSSLILCWASPSQRLAGLCRLASRDTVCRICSSSVHSANAAASRVASRAAFWMGKLVRKGIKPNKRTQAKTSIKIYNLYRASSWFEVLHTTDRTQSAVMTLKPGASTGDQPQSHENSQQLLLLIEGELLAELDGQSRNLKSGDIVIIAPKVKHKFTNKGKTSARTFNVYCPPEYRPGEKG